MISLAEDIRDRFKWRQVITPRLWAPREVGEELVGYYGGRTLRNGPHGQYEVALVHVPMDGSYMITGVKFIQLLDASMCQIGHPIRVVWKGLVPTARGHEMKDFDVLVAEGECVPAESLPVLQPQVQA